MVRALLFFSSWVHTHEWQFFLHILQVVKRVKDCNFEWSFFKLLLQLVMPPRRRAEILWKKEEKKSLPSTKLVSSALPLFFSEKSLDKSLVLRSRNVYSLIRANFFIWENIFWVSTPMTREIIGQMRYPDARRRQQVWESGSLVGKPHTDSGSRPRVVGIKDLTDLLKGSETDGKEDLTKRGTS